MKEPIILVEDDDDLRESLHENLSAKGFDVVAVASGQAYRQQIEARPFAVAIIDIGLPDANGLDLATATRAQSTTRIIFLTASGEVDDRVHGYAAGGHLYLVKPVASQELCAAIHSLATVEPVRSLGSEADEEAEVWQLDEQHWDLYAPNQKKVHLTAKELAFFKLLRQVDGQRLQRETALNGLYPRLDPYTSRALDALISRLRIKVKKHSGLGLPLQSFYGEGFVFSAPLK